jgi:hypothetical protein
MIGLLDERAWFARTERTKIPNLTASLGAMGKSGRPAVNNPQVTAVDGCCGDFWSLWLPLRSSCA